VESIIFWLSISGNIASLIALGLTIAVLCGVKSLKSFYVTKATLPNQLKELSELRENIDQLLSGKFDTSNKDKAIEYSSAARVNIQNLLPKLKKMDKEKFSKQIEPNAKSFMQAKDIFTSIPIKANARVMNGHLLDFLRSTELVITDDDWRRT
jgi:hypothetical protein